MDMALCRWHISKSARHVISATKGLAIRRRGRRGRRGNRFVTGVTESDTDSDRHSEVTLPPDTDSDSACTQGFGIVYPLDTATSSEDPCPQAQLCGICWSSLSDDTVSELRPCGHQFHTECIAQWNNGTRVMCGTCPFDRIPIEGLYVIPSNPCMGVNSATGCLLNLGDVTTGCHQPAYSPESPEYSLPSVAMCRYHRIPLATCRWYLAQPPTHWHDQDEDQDEEPAHDQEHDQEPEQAGSTCDQS